MGEADLRLELYQAMARYFDNCEAERRELRDLVRDLWALPIGIRLPDMKARVEEALNAD